MSAVFYVELIVCRTASCALSDMVVLSAECKERLEGSMLPARLALVIYLHSIVGLFDGPDSTHCFEDGRIQGPSTRRPTLLIDLLVPQLQCG
jgi:hypothetical protein